MQMVSMFVCRSTICNDGCSIRWPPLLMVLLRRRRCAASCNGLTSLRGCCGDRWERRWRRRLRQSSTTKCGHWGGVHAAREEVEAGLLDRHIAVPTPSDSVLGPVTQGLTVNSRQLASPADFLPYKRWSPSQNILTSSLHASHADPLPIGSLALPLAHLQSHRRHRKTLGYRQTWMWALRLDRGQSFWTTNG